jgi:hypothetical protein
VLEAFRESCWKTQTTGGRFRVGQRQQGSVRIGPGHLSRCRRSSVDWSHRVRHRGCNRHHRNRSDRFLGSATTWNVIADAVVSGPTRTSCGDRATNRFTPVSDTRSRRATKAEWHEVTPRENGNKRQLAADESGAVSARCQRLQATSQSPQGPRTTSTPGKARPTQLVAGLHSSASAVPNPGTGRPSYSATVGSMVRMVRWRVCSST